MSEDPTVPDQMPGSQGLETRVGRLETSMEFVKTEISHLASAQERLGVTLTNQISAIGAQLSTSGKTNWPVVGSFISVAVVLIGGFWSLTKSPLEAAIARNEGAIHDIKSEDKENFRDLAKAIKETASSIVPRGEHERIWREGDRRLDTLEQQVEQIRRNSTDFIRKRLEQLEAGQKS